MGQGLTSRAWYFHTPTFSYWLTVQLQTVSSLVRYIITCSPSFEPSATFYFIFKITTSIIIKKNNAKCQVWTECRSWSGFKLFAKVISRQQKSPLVRTEISITYEKLTMNSMCLKTVLGVKQQVPRVLECIWVYDMSQCMRFPTIWYVRPAKPQISLRIRAVWSEPLLVAWVFYDC